MSLSFLPLPIFTVLIVSSAIGMFIIAKTSWNRNIILLPIGYIFIGAGAIGGVLIRVNNEMHLFSDISWLALSVFFCTGSGIVMSLVGKYTTIKDIPTKKRQFLRIIVGTISFAIVMSLFLGVIYLKMKNII